MTLHIVSKSPFSSSALSDCANAVRDGDALLLIEDGVYALSSQMPEKLAATSLYCLAADAAARGLTVPGSVEAIDDARWVSLCTEQHPVVSWFK